MEGDVVGRGVARESLERVGEMVDGGAHRFCERAVVFVRRWDGLVMDMGISRLASAEQHSGVDATTDHRVTRWVQIDL